MGSSQAQHLDECNKQLAAAVHNLLASRKLSLSQNDSLCATPTTDPASLVAPREDLAEAHRLRQSMLAHVSQLEALLFLEEPSDFLRSLNKKTQLLACLGWLAEFQVLACIPMQGTVATSDVSELVGVPESQLLLVVQTMATVRFLHLPRAGHVAHTPLSAAFVKKPSLLDAALFASEVGAPAAFHMADATRNPGAGDSGTAYNFACRTTLPFSLECKQRQRLQRQCLAHLRYTIGEDEAGFSDVLMQYDWQGLAHATVVIVEAGVSSTPTVTALANLYPALDFVVQLCETGEGRRGSTASNGGAQSPHPRVSVQYRPCGSQQNVLNGSVYVLSFPAASPLLPSRELCYRVAAELQSHLAILANSQAVLFLVIRGVGRQVLHVAEGNPSAWPSSDENPDMESLARIRDLSLWQLADDREIELCDLFDLVSQVQDSLGSLAVVNRLSAQRGSTVALEIRYQAHSKRTQQVQQLWPAF